MSRLFLSHSSENNAEAVAIRDWLAGEGWNEVFLDLDPKRGIVAGERWERALNEAASRCEAVLFLISRTWLGSRWCMREFGLARKLNKRLFGVLVESIPIAELPADLTDAWQVVDLASGQDHLVLRVTLPRTHVEVHVTFSKEGLARLRNGLTKAGLDPRFFAWPPEHDPNRPPYRGLKPLEAEDAGIFFGRDAPIVEALDTLRGAREAAPPRLLVILGASGAGKSSFLRAGLLPRLAREDRAFLPLPVIRPERAAINGEVGLLRAIEAALIAHGLPQSRASIRDAIDAGSDGLRPMLVRLVEKVSSAARSDDGEAIRPAILLSIDQAEELFLSDGAEEGQKLLALIRDFVKEDHPQVIVVFTIRSDSYDQLETAKIFEGLRQQTMPLLPMPRGAYQTVIEGPAARLRDTDRKLSIEPRLTQALLEDIEKGGGSDALPLLAFTLEQLYLEYGGSGALKLADYEKFGGIRGAIEAGVDRALAAADSDPRIPHDREARLALLRRGLIPWLAGISPETGGPRRRVARLSDIPHEAAPLVALLVEQRLLSTDRIVLREGDNERSEVTIEPAHEAMLRQWGLLRGWLEEDFGALATLESVKRAARDWAANDRRKDWLNHSGSRLEDAEKVAIRDDLSGDFSADASDYLRACREREQEQQRERLARLGREREEQERQLRDAQALAAANRRIARRTGIGLVVALVLAACASWEWWTAQAQRDRAEQFFRAAIEETDGIVTRISSQLKDLVGISRKGILSILTVVEGQFDTIAKMNSGSSRLQLSHARMLSAFVDVLVELGELTEAQKRANQCESIMRPLVPETSEDSDMIEGLALCLEKRADSALWKGNFDEAARAYGESVGLRRRVVVQNPADNRSQMRFAHVLGYEAFALISAGHVQDALPLARESLSITTKLDSIDNDNATWRREYVESLNFNAMAMFYIGEPSAALPGYEQSRDIAKDMLAKDPNNATLKRFYSNLLGNVALAMMGVRRYDDALMLLQEDLSIKRDLVRIDPDNMLWRFELLLALEKLADDELNLKKVAQAVAHYREGVTLGTPLLKKDPDNLLWQMQLVGSVVNLADALTGTPDYDGVIKVLDEAVSLNPKYAAVAYNGRGNLHDAKSEYDLAIKNYAQAILLQPDYAIAYANRGGAYLAEGDRDRAIKDFNQAIQLKPNYAVAYNQRGNAYYSKREYDLAIKDYAQAISLQPDYAIAYANRGGAYLAEGDRDRAIKDFNQAIQLNPNYAVAYNQRGNVYYAKREYTLAIKDYAQAISLQPDYAIAYANRGGAYLAEGDRVRAIKDCDQAIELDPNHAPAYATRGFAYYLATDYDRAIADLSEAIKLDSAAAAPHNNRGAAYRAKGDYDRAIADFDGTIRLSPNFARAFYNRANTYRAKGDFDRALADYAEAIKRAPSEAGGLSAECWLHLVQREADASLGDCSKSLQLQAHDAYALDSRGFAFLELTQPDKALADFDAALRIEPRLAEALFGRGLAKLKTGDILGGNADIGAATASRSGIVEQFRSMGVM
jgi:tetratricopeptide (TPR) repeat protein